MTTRTPVRENAKHFAKQLAKENPDYNYLTSSFGLKVLRFLGLYL